METLRSGPFQPKHATSPDVDGTRDAVMPAQKLSELNTSRTTFRGEGFWGEATATGE